MPATLRTGGASHRVKLRLKGHALDHLHGRKWSVRLDLTGGSTLWGMRGFALQHPGIRGFEREWLFHRHVQAEGLLGLRYRFVRLVLNEPPLGIVELGEERVARDVGVDHREIDAIRLGQGKLIDLRPAENECFSLACFTGNSNRVVQPGNDLRPDRPVVAVAADDDRTPVGQRNSGQGSDVVPFSM